MKENKEYHGKWFVPKSRSGFVKIPSKNMHFVGDLEFNPIFGGTLVLRSEVIFAEELTEEIEVMFGDTSYGPVTLYNCLFVKLSTGKGSIYQYNVQFIIEGGHLPSIESMSYFTIHAELQNLNEWISKSGITVSYAEKPDDPFVDIRFYKPEKIRFQIDEAINGYFRFFLRGPRVSGFQMDAKIEQAVQIVFQQDQELSLKRILELLTIFQHLLMLGLNVPTYPTSIILFSNKHLQIYNNNRKIRRLPLYLLAARPYSVSNIDSLHPFKMLFDYAFLEKDFSKLIFRWYQMHEKVGSSFNLFFEQYYRMQRFDENTFLNYAQAAESYQAKMLKQSRMSEEFYNKMKSEILEAFNEADYPIHNQWLKEQLSFGNEAKLHDRLLSLVNRFENTDIVSQIGNVDEFVKLVKWSRNYYTHYSDTLKGKALAKSDLYFLTQKLRMLMIATILNDLGVDKLTAAEHVARYFKQLLR